VELGAPTALFVFEFVVVDALPDPMELFVSRFIVLLG
jgi:hypothetical protein